MTAPTLPYFHAQALKLRFAQDLSEAVAANHITELEVGWLQRVIDTSSVANDTAAPRVSTVTMTHGVPAGIDLASAILMEDETATGPVVYLNTLLFGLERFDDRKHLLSVLQTRFGTRMGETPDFERETVQDPSFESRMFRVVDTDADRLNALALQLQQVPSLQAMLRHALVEQIKRLMPAASVDLADHSVQIIETRNEAQPAVEQVVQVKSLEAVMLDRFLGRTLPADQHQRFLNELGQARDQTHSALYEQILSGVERSLWSSAEQRLGNFWHTPVGHGQTRRDYMGDVLTEAFRRELLERRHDGTINPSEFRRLRALLGVAQWGNESPARAKRLTVTVNDGEPIKLSGALLIEGASKDETGLQFYSAVSGLKRFADLDAMDVHFSTTVGRTELLPYLSLEDHALVLDAASLKLSIRAADDSVFLELVDAIIGLQARNLKYALGLNVQDGERRAVLIDDALDIRPLIDRHLWRLDSGNRWPAVPGGFHARWVEATPEPGETAVSVSVPRSVAEETEPYVAWLQAIHALEVENQRIDQAHPGLRACARSVLNGQLSILGSGRLDALDLQVQLPGAEPPKDLITLLLEQVSGHQAAPLPGDCAILSTVHTSATVEAVKRLSPLLINHVLDRARQLFSAAYSKQVRGFFSTTPRPSSVEFRPGPLACEIDEQLLRIDLAHERKAKAFTSSVLDLLEQLLNYPQRRVRNGHRYDAVEVYGVLVSDGGQAPAQRLSNLFAFEQPSHPEKGVALWSPVNGIRVFASSAVLMRYIKIRLRATRTREQWLNLVVDPDKHSIRRALTDTLEAVSLSLERLDGHFIEQTRLTEQERQYRHAEYALASSTRHRVNADLVVKMQNVVEVDEVNESVADSLSGAVNLSLFNAIVPSWIKNADPDDLAQYIDLLRRYYGHRDPDLNFFADVPTLKAFARERLLAQLKIDFPEQTPDPDNVQITVTQYVASTVGLGEIPSGIPAATLIHHETLTEYALNHFAAYQDAILTATAPQGGPTQPSLTASYLKALIRTLDVGNQFRQLLATRLDKSAADYTTRQTAFCTQWPALMLEEACRNKLEKQLGSKAWQYIESVITMPDGLARQAVDEEDVIISPIRLLAAPGVSANPIPGCYLIAPKDPLYGPVILYTVGNQDFMFKEYRDREALLADIQHSSSLQSLFMRRVTAEVQALYGHRSFYLPPVWRQEFYVDYPVFPLAPVTLDIQPIMGNALHQQFEDTVQLLKDMANAQTVTTAEAEWASFKQLMTLGAEQLLMFVPGRLGLMIGAWQSFSFAQAAAVSASNQQWGQALSEFTAALSMFAASKQSTLKEGPLEEIEEVEYQELSGEKPAGQSTSTVPSAVATDQEDEAAPASGFSWRNDQLSNDLKMRLKTFEASGVALVDLTRLEELPIYQDRQGLKRYASVAGSVYEVKNNAGQWRIVSDTRSGPTIKLNAHGQWELDLQWGLKGGGPVVSRYERRRTNREVDQIFVTYASGMRDIRVLYREQATTIRQAHARAQGYLRTCLDNLSPAADDALDPRAVQILSNFFGQQAPSAALVEKVRDRTSRLLAALLDVSLSPDSSSRFVLGSTKPQSVNASAFVISEDPLKRIFLTETFFLRPVFHIKRWAPALMGFNSDNHAQASILIHELSHQVLDTYDIAYVEAPAPFIDLLESNTAHRTSIKNTVTLAQQHFLSHRTSPDHLFQVRENGVWRDIGREAGEGKDRVLQLTKKTTLDEARTEFFANDDVRSEVILNNADSLALLATLLGRELFV